MGGRGWIDRGAGAPYVPALDGLRALAVTAVVLFHLGFAWASGGFLGVSLFFTLSGFLITRLLLDEHARTGRIDLAAFWGRRVRRLAPAALACLAGVLAAGRLTLDARSLEALPGDLAAAALSVANWRFVTGGESYAELFTAGPSPVLHFWSLAIEEQFYLAFPVLVAGVLAVRVRPGRMPGRVSGRLRGSILGCVLGGLFAASVAAAVVSSDTDLGYYGTHIRAAELLAGGLLAGMARARRLWAGLGVPALVAFVVLVALVRQDDGWLYSGGFAALALVAWCPLIIAAAGTGGFARALGHPALAAIGRRSYGIYLYHWPVLTLLTPARLGLGVWPTRLVQLATVAVLNEASFRWLERPIRERRLLASTVACRAAIAVTSCAVVATALLLPLPRPAEMTFVEPPQQATVLMPAPSVVASPASGSPAADSSSALERAVGRTSSDPFQPDPSQPDPNQPDPVRPEPMRVVVVGGAPDVVAAVRAHLPEGAELVDRTTPGCVLVPIGQRAPMCPVGDDVTRGAALAVVGIGAADLAALAPSVPPEPEERLAEVADLYRQLDPVFAALIGLAPRVVLVEAADEPSPSDAEAAAAALMLRHSIEKAVLATTTMTAIERDELATALRAGLAPVESDALRVMVIGDSTGYGLAVGIAHAGLPITVLWAGHVGCPLATTTAIGMLGIDGPTDHCPTLTQWRQQITEFEPDIVLAVSSIAEPSPQRYPGDDAWYEPGDPEFAAAHDLWLSELSALADGTRVMIATAPASDPGRPAWAQDRLVDGWNRQIMDWAAAQRIEVLDYAGMLTTAQEAAGRLLRPDGAHLDDAAVDLLGRQTAEHLLAVGQPVPDDPTADRGQAALGAPQP